MKKITLVFFAISSLAGHTFAQAGFTITAPPYNNGISSVRAPNGTTVHTVQRTVMYVQPSELYPMGPASITNFSIQYYSGTGSVTVPGNFTVYMQNTADLTYSIGTSWTTAISGMSPVFLGTIAVPGTTGSAIV